MTGVATKLARPILSKTACQKGQQISDSASSKSISESVKDNGEVRESSEEKNEVGLAAKAVSEQICYNKEKSFFDTISCEAIERNKGGYQKLDRLVILPLQSLSLSQ
ncbi:uncharacterized protein LOC136034506 [Artemia franciscana]|uniref:uncharacterized protein LOC136034506 n=1 Tax=Artemia franciscana TaxID=6661 RepID=UPI0032DB23CD